jgi:Co/Zn/Cd efflux system component
MLVVLGLSLIAEIVHRWLRPEHPAGVLILGFAALSLVVNGSVLRMLSKFRHAPEPHLRATWPDTRADVLVNLGVLMSGAAIAVTGFAVIDLLAGAALSAFVIHEGIEIWRDTTERVGGIQLRAD